MKKILFAFACLAINSLFVVSYAGQPLEHSVSAGAASELRPYSAAAERGGTRPGSDGRPATV